MNKEELAIIEIRMLQQVLNNLSNKGLISKLNIAMEMEDIFLKTSKELGMKKEELKELIRNY